MSIDDGKCVNPKRPGPARRDAMGCGEFERKMLVSARRPCTCGRCRFFRTEDGWSDGKPLTLEDLKKTFAEMCGERKG